MNRKWFDIAYAMVCLVILLSYGIIVAKAQQRQTQATFPIFIPLMINEQSAGHCIPDRVASLHTASMTGITIHLMLSRSLFLPGPTSAAAAPPPMLLILQEPRF